MISPGTITIGLAGIGGYGENYLTQIFDESHNLGIRLVGAVDPFAERSPLLARLDEAQVPVYATVDDFYANHSADLLIIVSPIHHHMAQTRLALAHGSNVLCEKPLAATIQDGLQTLALEQASGRFVAVGYNWSFVVPIQSLKREIMAGRFGRPLRAKSLVLWQRWQPYYTRNGWAGRIQSERGAWILDSPVNNATAHYLHNLFYLLGSKIDSSAQPADVQAELYRANAIENYDTAALRCHTADGVEILFYTAHPVPANVEPVFEVAFEQAVVSYQGPGSEIVARFSNGEEQYYGDPSLTAHTSKLPLCVENIRQGSRPLCGIAASTAQTRAMNGTQESALILPFPAGLIQDEGERGWVEGLSEAMLACYQRNLLPSELGDVPWAQAGRVVDLRGYDHFPRFGNS
jgi:predicted dehydrogenase